MHQIFQDMKSGICFEIIHAGRGSEWVYRCNKIGRNLRIIKLARCVHEIIESLYETLFLYVSYVLCFKLFTLLVEFCPP
jgi:hypothetical protein